MTDDAKRCAGCRHWKHYPQNRAAILEGYRGCGSCEKITREPDSKAPRIEAVVLSVRHERMENPATLVTPKDFGCVLWEAKT